MGNALVHEKSRYLKQHSQNPVEWHPWSAEAFEKASAEDKPLLVSIGYSSCHWCHVMAHESFEDPDIAALINENYIPIKVDKEELPDVDGFYMEFLTRLSGRGGWPLNVFVNPNRAPFYGMSYVPKAQLPSLLTYVRNEYDKNSDIQTQKIDGIFAVRAIGTEKAREFLSGVELAPPSRPQGPQFPQGVYLSFALQRGQRQMVADELENLILKGLFDHIEGGWFRYSVDPEWKIPHFEKMLYDQAALLYLCAQCYSIASEVCSYAISRTLDWLQNHMKLPNGLYGSATDADTREGEGFYYTEEPPRDGAARRLFRADFCGVHEGRILPWLDFEYFRSNQSDSAEILAAHRGLRSERVAPELDAKAVFSWNAFLGYAILACARATENETVSEIGRSLYEDLLRFADEWIPHTIYGEERIRGNEYLEDYAGLLLLSSAIAEGDREMDVETLLTMIGERFFKEGYLFHTGDPRFESLALWQDTPVPSGGAMLLTALLNLGRTEFDGLDGLGVAEVAAANPSFFGLWCAAMDRAHSRGNLER